MSDKVKLTRDITREYESIGTISGVARSLGIQRATVRSHLKAAGLYDERPLFAGRVLSIEPTKRKLPAKGEVKRYLFTSAQNNTRVAPKVWDTILTVAEHYDAELMIGTFTYNKSSYGTKSSKRGRGPQASDRDEMWYDSEIEPYIVDEPVQVAPGIIWCGEMNILPTAERPLRELDSYTARASGIFPHVKLAMKSVPSGKFEPTKFNYTTGTVTKRNYIQKKAGLKADFHHVYGALLLEIDSDGDWFIRQINVDRRGVAYDIDLKFENGEVTSGHRALTVCWGDIHTAEIDQVTARLAWGEGGIMDTLRPEQQMMHDILDFRARNVHTAKKGLIHDRFKAYIKGQDSVEEELGHVATLLEQTSRDDCRTVVVDSNHDSFMMEWLRIGDYKQDPVNAVYFLEAQLYVYKTIATDPEAPVNLLRWAVERKVGGEMPNVMFLNEDESYVVAGIEHGMHGHLGPNGARGTAGNLSKMGRRINRGHEHSAGIHDGVYTSGITGKTDQGYNKGPSSWSSSHIITYANGKRAIYTMWNGKWRA